MVNSPLDRLFFPPFPRSHSSSASETGICSTTSTTGGAQKSIQRKLGLCCSSYGFAPHFIFPPPCSFQPNESEKIGQLRDRWVLVKRVRVAASAMILGLAAAGSEDPRHGSNCHGMLWHSGELGQAAAIQSLFLFPTWQGTSTAFLSPSVSLLLLFMCGAVVTCGCLVMCSSSS